MPRPAAAPGLPGFGLRAGFWFAGLIALAALALALALLRELGDQLVELGDDFLLHGARQFDRAGLCGGTGLGEERLGILHAVLHAGERGGARSNEWGMGSGEWGMRQLRVFVVGRCGGWREVVEKFVAEGFGAGGVRWLRRRSERRQRYHGGEDDSW